MIFSRELPEVAYFSMEVGIDPEIHSYSGGLGILAGDTIRSFADLSVPAIGITQLNDLGYCHQELDEEGNQKSSPESWDPTKHLEKLPEKATLKLEGDEIKIGAWEKEVEAIEGTPVSIIFLDTDLEENPEKYQDITRRLYNGDQRWRLMQEAVLGIGGVRMLEELGHEIDVYHMNESHSALLSLELLKKNDMDREKVKNKCVFTTHTPEEAGHDAFSYELVDDILGGYIPTPELKDLSTKEKLHMTHLAMNLSRYINAVSKRHEEVTRDIFPDHDIDSITNGIHTSTWVSESFQELYDEYIPGWRNNHYKLKYTARMPKEKIREAHINEKEKMMDYVNKRSDTKLNNRVFTIGFARRAAPYKRADLIFHDLERLMNIDKEVGDFQVIFAGIAHPEGGASKDMIRRVNDYIEDVRDDIEMTYLENYDINMAMKLTSGVDLWLNVPERGREACGTSGMKAACNGIPQLGTLDGWWIEGHIEDATGWKIGPRPDKKIEDSYETDSQALYEKLEEKIIPSFYADKKKWTGIMKNTIAFNASFFNTHRMVREYTLNAYSQ